MFPFLDNLELQQLKTELPNYIAACEDVDPSHDVLTFWKNHVWDIAHTIGELGNSNGVIKEKTGISMFPPVL